MPATFRRKFSRMRGSKTHGWGMKKKHRGGGSQGGKGMSGLMKHKKSWMIKNDPDHFGRIGFTPISRSNEKTINLRDVDMLARNSGMKEIDLTKYGYTKLLGTGKINSSVIVKIKKSVASAKEKIESAGGKVIE